MSETLADVTFVIFTFNEERRIERVIQNFINFGRVLVIDNESTDQTLEIAQRYGCEILLNKNLGWVEDEVTAARVKETVRTEWIYWGFADEMLDRPTIEAIVGAVRSGRYDVVNITRKDYYYGTFCQSLMTDRANRIFKKNAIDFGGNRIHGFGRVVPGARICKLPGKYFVHHFISNTAKLYVYAMDRHTDIEGAENRQMPNATRLLLSSIKMVIFGLLFRRGYRGGIPSAFLLCNAIYYRWLAAMKVYERKSNLARDTIEIRNNEIRDRILKSLNGSVPAMQPK